MRPTGIWFDTYTAEARVLETRRSRLFGLALVAGLMSLPILAGPWLLGEFTFFFITLIAVYGLCVTVGMAGQINIAQSAFVGAGAFTAAKLSFAGVPFWLVVPIAALVTGVAGALTAYFLQFVTAQIHLGFGSPDLTTLMSRLPQDRVPMLIGTAMVGLVWQPGGWHFSVRPTYSHEFGGLFAHLQDEKGDTLRIAAISTQNQAGFVDQVNGVRHLASLYPDRFTLTSTQWADTSPVSLSAQVRAALADDPDILMIGGTTAQVISAVQAMDELGRRVPIVMSTHNGLYEVAKGIALERLEGDYAAFSFAAPGRENLPMRDVFEANATEGEWGLITAQATAQAILALRVLERAIADVGAENITGQAMYDALLGYEYSEEELLGVLPTLDFDDTAPFPIGEIAATAEVVRDGEIVDLTGGWFAVPALDKW